MMLNPSLVGRGPRRRSKVFIQHYILASKEETHTLLKKHIGDTADFYYHVENKMALKIESLTPVELTSDACV